MAIFFQGRLDEAETEFRAMLELRPDDPGAMNGMGAIAVERNELDVAQDWFSRVIAVEPENSLAHNGLDEVEHRR
jgi:Flp pilus assembly protein TadD